MDEEILRAVAEQVMGKVSGGKVERVGRMRLRMVRFLMDGREYQAIEQNPEKPSAWGKLARAGHAVVQVRDVESGKYAAVVVDGKVRVYGKSHR
jgi:hypothetical protein